MGDVEKRKIAELAESMQAIVCYLPDMDREELRVLAQKCMTMARIVLERLGPERAESGVWPKAAEDLGDLGAESQPFPPPYPRCEYAGRDGAERCSALGTHRVAWESVTGKGEAVVCGEHERAVLLNVERLGIAPKKNGAS
jgi:hypothetical protein